VLLLPFSCCRLLALLENEQNTSGYLSRPTKPMKDREASKITVSIRCLPFRLPVSLACFLNIILFCDFIEQDFVSKVVERSLDKYVIEDITEQRGLPGPNGLALRSGLEAGGP
jgi:hypothetical protein